MASLLCVEVKEYGNSHFTAKNSSKKNKLISNIKKPGTTNIMPCIIIVYSVIIGIGTGGAKGAMAPTEF